MSLKINFVKSTYGIALCILIGIVAVFLAAYIPVGAVVIAILIGIVVGNLFKLDTRFQKGITFSEKQLLSFAVALMGVNLNFLILEKLGIKSIFILMAIVLTAILSSLLFAKICKLDKKFALLLGIGNSICGSSAIAATEQIIGAKQEEVGLSIAIVNFLGTLGIFVLPFIGSIFLKFSEINSGILIGSTLQAVGQVVAAGFSVSNLSGQTATIVKMARILMLTPVVFTLMFIFLKKNKNNPQQKNSKNARVPLFIIGFVLFSLIPTFDLLPENYIHIISRVSHYSLIVAMAAIGLRITFSTILKDGKSALLVGSLIFVVQIVLSSSLIMLFLK